MGRAHVGDLASSSTYVGNGSKSTGPGDRLFPLWTFLATTGCRRGEALGSGGRTST